MKNTLKRHLILVQHIVQKITANLDLLLFLAEIFSNLCLDFSTKNATASSFCPIQIELGLVNNFMDATVKRDDYKLGPWNISDIQAKCNLLTFDNSLDNEYASHLLSGKSLLINFNTWSHTSQPTGNDKNLSANIHRALSRLKSIYVTLNSIESVQHKEANNLFHPIAAKLNDGYDVTDEHSFRIQIGNKTMPEHPITSVTETLYQLRKTVCNPLHI